jgi:uncharacterized protein (TIGR01777 family)
VALRTSNIIDAPIDEVFSWHERPGAIRRLSPPWQPVRVEREAASLRDGRAVLRLPGGVRWVAQHGEYEPPNQFVDTLVSLPLPWRHRHEFEAVSPSTTRLTDVVETPIPGSLLDEMFRYRHRQLVGDLDSQRILRALQPDPMTIALTGSSGLIGSALAAFLGTSGHTVIRLVRRVGRSPQERTWDPEDPDPSALDGVDAVVHLAGASIAGRFTDEHKALVRRSRIEPTRRLAVTLAEMADGPRVLVTASAVGIYGADRHDELLTEDSASGHGFLADLVTDWEAATEPAAQAGVRVVQVRNGIVQSPAGGMLRVLRPLFSAGLGGTLGGGRQWVPWIGIDDVLDVFARCVVDPELHGPVNAVAPNPVHNSTYTATLGKVLRRPARLPVPSFGPRLLLGDEGAREFALAGQRVVPERLNALGHTFRHPTLEACLRHLLGRVRPKGAEN